MTKEKKPAGSINKKYLNPIEKLKTKTQKFFDKIINNKVVDKRLLIKNLLIQNIMIALI